MDKFFREGEYLFQFLIKEFTLCFFSKINKRRIPQNQDLRSDIATLKQKVAEYKQNLLNGNTYELEDTKSFSTEDLGRISVKEKMVQIIFISIFLSFLKCTFVF